MAATLIDLMMDETIPMPAVDPLAGIARVKSTHPTRRWFVRCTDCLTVAAVTETPHTYEWRCHACGGPIESMGEVHRQRLVNRYTVSACDDRCTHARGPICDCPCGGANHGTHRTVTIIRDAGPIPRVRMPEPEKARHLATEYREARARALAQLDSLTARKRRGEYLPPADFARLRTIQTGLRKAHEARTHAARMRALTFTE